MRQPVTNPRSRTTTMFRTAVAVAAALCAAGCPATSEDVQPPEDQLFFPTGLAIAEDESVVFVTNGNSDLRYDSSTLVAIDAAEVDAAVQAWVTAGQSPDAELCARDQERGETLVCDESAFLVPGATVRIGNFAGEAEIQTLMSGVTRVFVSVRGDPSLTFADFDPATRELSCGGTERVPRCDDDHRLTRLFNDPSYAELVDEPFGLYVDGYNGYAMLAHLTTGIVTLADAPVDGGQPVISDVKSGLFDAASTGRRGAVALAGRTPGDPSSLVYLTSRVESRVAMVYVDRPSEDEPLRIVPTDYFFVNAVFPSLESRDLVFSDGGDRLHVINRQAPMLITIDTSMDAFGRPANEVLSAVELCDEASLAAAADLGEGTRVFVSCYGDGQVWVIDPVGGVIDATIDVGRGPNALAVAVDSKRLYTTNFLEDTVSVVDLTPAAATENRVVLRIGRPRSGD